MLALPVRGCHPLRPVFPDGSGCLAFATGLVRVRSPLLAESRLMSFPPATEMFQFAGFASAPYGFRYGYPQELLPGGGLPHSEIPGSPIARISPGLFAACHVLHRLSVPRHPPDALLSRLITGASRCGVTLFRRETPQTPPRTGSSPNPGATLRTGHGDLT